MNDRKRFLDILFILALASASFAQNPVQYNFDFAGTIHDTRTKSVVPGLELLFVGPTKVETFTNANGEFKVVLATGEYQVTVDGIPSEKFRGVVKIGGRPSPDFVDFFIDVDSILSVASKNYPNITAFQLPKFPLAAQAVRARGLVQVYVAIDTIGRVTSAKALSGHPLLIQSSIEAAKKFAFQPSNSSEERSANITFVFLPFEESNGQVRYSNPYRINVVAPKTEINF